MMGTALLWFCIGFVVGVGVLAILFLTVEELNEWGQDKLFEHGRKEAR